MKQILWVLFLGFFCGNSFAQTQSDTLLSPEIIYKINPISFVESPQNLTLGIEKKWQGKYAFVQEIGGSFGEYDYYHNLFFMKGTSEIRRYFWTNYHSPNYAFQNKYFALDMGYQYAGFQMDEWVGEDCNSWDCNYFRKMQFRVKNYRFCTHLKYGKQLLTPIKNIFFDYFVGLGYEWVIGRSPLTDNQQFRGNIQPVFFKLSNGNLNQMSFVAGIRIGYGKP